MNYRREVKTAGLKENISNLLKNYFGSWDDVVSAIKQYSTKNAGVVDRTKVWLMITLLATLLGCTAKDVLANPIEAASKAKQKLDVSIEETQYKVPGYERDELKISSKHLTPHYLYNKDWSEDSKWEDVFEKIVQSKGGKVDDAYMRSACDIIYKHALENLSKLNLSENYKNNPDVLDGMKHMAKKAIFTAGGNVYRNHR